MSNADQLGVIRELARALLGEVESLAGAAEQPATPDEGDFYELIRAYEISLIRRALARARGNQARAARMLRLNPSTLHHKMKLYDIRPDPKPPGPDDARADSRCADRCAQACATP